MAVHVFRNEQSRKFTLRINMCHLGFTFIKSWVAFYPWAVINSIYSGEYWRCKENTTFFWEKLEIRAVTFNSRARGYHVFSNKRGNSLIKYADNSLITYYNFKLDIIQNDSCNRENLLLTNVRMHGRTFISIPYFSLKTKMNVTNTDLFEYQVLYNLPYTYF
jgi:hypothetical protein